MSLLTRSLRGFTLVELLLTVAILGVLSATMRERERSMLKMRLAVSALVLMGAVLCLTASICCAQPEQFGLPERLSDLTVLGELAQRGDVTPFDQTEILVTWLIREHRNPSPAREGLGGPIDSGWIISNILDALYAKSDPVTVAEMAADGQAEPTLRDAMCIVLGMKGDSSQTQKLIAIVRSHANPYYRARAAGALGTLGATEAIPVLEKALTDEYGVETWPDVGPDRRRMFYPVRQYATESLRMLQDSGLVAASRERSKTFAKALRDSRGALVNLDTYLRRRGWRMAWRKNNQEVIATNAKSSLRVTVGNGYAVLDGCRLTLATAPKLSHGQVLVPRSLAVTLAYRTAPLSSLMRAAKAS